MAEGLSALHHRFLRTCLGKGYMCGGCMSLLCEGPSVACNQHASDCLPVRVWI
jgi:hypothetical protein